MELLSDHGLPLVALKEQRRELVMSLAGRPGPLRKDLINQLAAVQSAIAALESVITDLDEEMATYVGNGTTVLHVVGPAAAASIGSGLLQQA